jgi:hypothetical protein
VSARDPRFPTGDVFTNHGPCSDCQFGKWTQLPGPDGKSKATAPPCEISPIAILYVMNWDTEFYQSIRENKPNLELPLGEAAIVGLNLTSTAKTEAFSDKGLVTMFRSKQENGLPSYTLLNNPSGPVAPDNIVFRTALLEPELKKANNTWMGYRAVWMDQPRANISDAYGQYMAVAKVLSARYAQAMKKYKEDNILSRITVEPYTRQAQTPSNSPQLSAPSDTVFADTTEPVPFNPPTLPDTGDETTNTVMDWITGNKEAPSDSLFG